MKIEATLRTAWCLDDKAEFGRAFYRNPDGYSLVCVEQALYHLGFDPGANIRARMVASTEDPGFPTWDMSEVNDTAPTISDWLEWFAARAAAAGCLYVWLEGEEV